MFTILGGDGKEYGPVETAKVQEWIAGGRATLQTKARRADSTEWKALGDFPEFAGMSVPPPVAAVIPPTPSSPASRSIEERAVRAGTLDIGGCIKRGFATGAANFLPLLGTGLLVGLACGLAGAIPLLGILVTFTLTGVFYGGLYYYALKKVRGEPTTLGDAFSGFSVCFGQLVLATIVVTILTILGFVCLILPGIYLAVCWMFTYAIVRDKGLPFWDAMELGRQVITRQWFRVFGFLLLLTLIVCVVVAVPAGMMIAGAAAAESTGAPSLVLMGFGGLGIVICSLVIMPFFLATLMHAYEDMFSEPAALSPSVGNL
jgi:hypothetical protein